MFRQILIATSSIKTCGYIALACWPAEAFTPAENFLKKYARRGESIKYNVYQTRGYDDFQCPQRSFSVASGLCLIMQSPIGR